MQAKRPVWVQYGLQRTGTNWIRELLAVNFGVKMTSNSADRISILHKHTQKVRDMTFADFERDVASELGVDAKRLCYVVSVKHPYSWYESYCKWALKCRSPHYSANQSNPNYARAYNRFYEKWLEFHEQAPQRVFFFRYESVLESLEAEMNRFQAHFGLKRVRQGASSYRDVKKVAMSSTFDKNRAEYYREKRWKQQIKRRDLLMLRDEASDVVASAFQYEVLRKNDSWGAVDVPTAKAQR